MLEMSMSFRNSHAYPEYVEETSDHALFSSTVVSKEEINEIVCVGRFLVQGGK